MLRIIYGMNPSPQEADDPLISKAENLKDDPERPGSGRDPEDRPVTRTEEVKEKTLDKTLADSFPTSDPPSSIPNPSCDENGVCQDEDKAA